MRTQHDSADNDIIETIIKYVLIILCKNFKNSKLWIYFIDSHILMCAKFTKVKQLNMRFFLGSSISACMLSH